MHKYNFNFLYGTLLRDKNLKSGDADKALMELLSVNRATIYNYKKLAINDKKSLSEAEIKAICDFASISREDFVASSSVGHG